jgi:hypothetical protein
MGIEYSQFGTIFHQENQYIGDNDEEIGEMWFIKY